MDDIKISNINQKKNSFSYDDLIMMNMLMIM